MRMLCVWGGVRVLKIQLLICDGFWKQFRIVPIVFSKTNKSLYMNSVQWLENVRILLHHQNPGISLETLLEYLCIPM